MPQPMIASRLVSKYPETWLVLSVTVVQCNKETCHSVPTSCCQLCSIRMKTAARQPIRVTLTCQQHLTNLVTHITWHHTFYYTSQSEWTTPVNKTLWSYWLASLSHFITSRFNGLIIELHHISFFYHSM